jgi:hypothetical protein
MLYVILKRFGRSRRIISLESLVSVLTSKTLCVHFLILQAASRILLARINMKLIFLYLLTVWHTNASQKFSTAQEKFAEKLKETDSCVSFRSSHAKL